MRISHIISICFSPHYFQIFQASAVFQLWVGAFSRFSMGCVEGLCHKGAATSRVLQKFGVGQGKDKALLGRDGCAANAATIFLSLLL